VNWQFKTVNVGSGAQTLTWTYSKNGSGVAGQDRAWVDQVSFGLVAPTIITQPSSVTVDAGSNATFTVVAAATPPIFYRWFYNGSALTDGAGTGGATTATLTVSNVLPNRVGNYSVLISNSVGTATSANAVLSLSTNVTLEQALDGPGLTYTVGGTGQPWKGQQTVTRDNVDAAQTGLCTDSTYTYMKATVTGPTPVTFWWKVSSEQDHDYLRFMVDAVDQVKISGEVDWQQVTYNVASGTHELQWRYSKNASLTANQDRGWVDQVYLSTNTPAPVVVVGPSAPAILIQPVSQTVDASDTVEISVAVSGTAPFTYQWYRDATNRVTDGGNVGGATTAALTLFNVLETQAGNYSVIVSNSAGFVISLSGRLTVLPVVDLAEAVDAGTLFLTTGGDADWIGHTVMTHDGVDAGRSGIVSHNQSSIMETMVNGPGSLSFWWKASSETNADWLSLSVGGVEQAALSGETGWQPFSITLPAGPQLLEWIYAKNGSGTVGADRGWVDQIAFTTNVVSVVVTNPPVGVMGVQVSVVDNILYLTWEASAAKTYKVFYKDHLADPTWTLLDGEVLVTWKVVDGQIVPDVVIATTQDVLAGQTRFYKVLEY
jgi:hypothetical protein